MRTLRLTVPFFVLATACGAPKTPAPAAAPEAPPSEPAPPETSESVEPPAEDAAPEDGAASAAAVSDEDRAKARSLVDEGRAVQREKGEGGAEEAIALYRQALEHDPEFAAALWELGWSYQVLDRLDEAMKAWEQLRALDPDYPELETYYPVLKMRYEQKEKLSKLPDPGMLPEPETEPYDGPTLTFAAVGDVQTGRAWPEHRAVLPPNDGAGYFDAVKDWLRNADITFGNLEQALADGGDSSKCGPRSTKCFAFRVPTSHADLLADAGFDMMSIANNHAGDFGQAGRDATMAALDARGIVYSGPVGVIATKEVNGLRVGMVAFSTGAGVYRVQQLDVARKVIADVARSHDIVVASFHGGAEGASATHVPKETETFYGENRGNVYEFAHTLVDAGADLVFGHGPHVLRGMEIYKGRFIAYSLGNFSSYKTFNLSRNLGWSTVAHVEVAPNGVALRAKLNPVVIVDPGKPIKDQKRRAIREVRRLSDEDFGDPLFDARGEWVRPETETGPVARVD